jgi:hypothetical protein
VSIFGWPIKDEQQNVMLEDGNPYTVQEFERAWLHWRPGEDVGIVRLGVMYNQLRAQLAQPAGGVVN